MSLGAYVTFWPTSLIVVWVDERVDVYASEAHSAPPVAPEISVDSHALGASLEATREKFACRAPLHADSASGSIWPSVLSTSSEQWIKRDVPTDVIDLARRPDLAWHLDNPLFWNTSMCPSQGRSVDRKKARPGE